MARSLRRDAGHGSAGDPRVVRVRKAGGMLLHGERHPAASTSESGGGRRTDADHVTSMRDAVALARVANGDEAALRELVERYGALVHGTALRAWGDRGLAEECAQDVFERVWREAGRYD